MQLLLLGSMLATPLGAWAQLPPNQPEQDCISALPVCQDIFVQSNSYVGEGNNPSEIDDGPSCLDSGEKNDVWYIFTVQTSGDLSFTITPNNLTDDYDWAVYDLTTSACSEIFTNPDLEVSCNWSFVPGLTGPNGQGPGGFFNPFNPTIPVEAGEVYVVNVSNFSSTNDGYILDFSASTAQIFDDQPPRLQLGNVCQGDRVPISFSENVQCQTVNPADFVVTGSDGSTLAVTDVRSDLCQAGGSFDDSYELVVNPQIEEGGTYSVELVGEVLDICANVAVLSTETAEVDELSAAFLSDLTAICQDSCINFTYTGLSAGPSQTFNWEFGTGAFPETSPLPSPVCIEFGEAGLRDVSLTVSLDGCSRTETQSIEVFELPTAEAGDAASVCQGDEGVELAGLATGGRPTYVYEWSCGLPDPADCQISDPSLPNPVVDPVVGIGGQVWYSLQVSDANGCVSPLDSVLVRVAERPIANAGPDATICAIGPGAFLDGGADSANTAPEPFLYEWQPAAGLSETSAANPFARPDTTTTYTLVITAGNGCKSDPAQDPNSRVTVVVDSIPVVDAGMDTLMCKGDTIQLMGTASITGPDFEYVWTPANTGFVSDPTAARPEVSPDFSTLFFLVATSQATGCTSLADSVRVTVSPTPTVSAGPNRSICLQEQVQLQGSALGDPDATLYEYEWMPARGLSDPMVLSPQANPDTTTTYTLLATSPFGCGSNQASMTVTVKPSPLVDALTQDTLSCEGEAFALVAQAEFTTTPPAPITYTWRPDSSMLGNPNRARVEVAPTDATTYVVTASISGDCPSRDTVRVDITPRFEAMAEADTNVICSGEGVQLMASGGLGNPTYNWLPAETVNDATSATPTGRPDTTTTFLVVVSEGACADTAAVDVNVNPTPIADYFSSEPSGCEGLAVSFFESSSDALSFIWDFGDGSEVSNEANPIHVFEASGSFPVTLTVVGAGGCESSVSTTTVTIAAPVEAGFVSSPGLGEELFLPGAEISLTDASTNAVEWIWDFGDGNGATGAAPTHTYTEAGSYEITLTAIGENGCLDRFSLGPLSVRLPELFIPNVFSPNGDGINDLYQVQYLGGEPFFLEVYDRWGNHHFESRNAADGWNGITPSGEPAKEGVYYYLVQIGDKRFTGDLTLLR